ncbi:sensor histidine kinase [Pseudoalteromonas sp. SSDWG2]|uniref:sensor histidine kinase n=1 Tax=Pseudoalteromonas sp. SSDWG2 TaxID=3139391 RepID=UPI003BA8E511
MKKLYLSLLCTALLSVVLLSWLIDSFTSDNKEYDDFTTQREVLSAMTSYLASYPQEQQVTQFEKLKSHFSLDIELSSNAALALPPALQEQLYQPQGLILEDEQGLYLVRSDEQLHRRHLIARLASPEPSKHDLMLTVLFYTGVSLCMWLPLIPLTRRISVLANAASKFAKGQLATRIKPSRYSYTQQLEHSFNSMAEQINSLLEENKLMASSLSHDIRTPIACLRFGLDAALDNDNQHSQKRYLQRMEKDLDTMESMLKSYLDFAALQQHNVSLVYSQVTLNDYLHEIIDQLSTQFDAIEVVIDCPKTLHITADLHWLARAIQNIVNNALRYAQSRINISARKEGKCIHIAITDDGPGIDEHEKDAVLRPFYQSAKHRNQLGYGLGLAICQKVMLWHHGELRVESACDLGGAKFTLSLPL